MENPVAIVKSQLSPSTILKGIVGAVIVFAILDLLGITDAVTRPVSYVRAKLAAAKAAA